MENHGLSAFAHSFSSTPRKFRARYIKYTLRHPMSACISYSNYMTLAQKPPIYLLRYISILGSHSVDKNKVREMMNIAQKDNSLEMLGHFFKGKFSDAFKEIA
jgi:hypothetical protein